MRRLTKLTAEEFDQLWDAGVIPVEVSYEPDEDWDLGVFCAGWVVGAVVGSVAGAVLGPWWAGVAAGVVGGAVCGAAASKLIGRKRG